MSLSDVTGAVMLVALVVYSLSGGADFGAGIWSMFTRGKKRERERHLIDDAIAPIWEANHVWLILIVVLLFVCFPKAFAAAGIALHIPLTVMLVGIVLRGAGFVFRHYAANEQMRRRWSRVFAFSSAIAPFFLGVSLGAVTADRIVIENYVPRAGFVGSWAHPFPFAVGVLAVVLFAFIAAVYLVHESNGDEREPFFRVAAISSGVLVGAVALGTIALAREEAPQFFEALLGSWWSWPLQIVTAIIALSLFAALVLRKRGLVRVLVVLQAAAIVTGWGAAQYPFLIRPELTLYASAAPDTILRVTLLALLAGSILLAPSFLWLYRVFEKA